MCILTRIISSNMQVTTTQTPSYMICTTVPIKTLSNKPIASFDLDDTIIKPKSGKTFAIDKSDWIFHTPEIPAKLIELSKNYSLVIFSNQKGKNDDSKIDDLKYKFTNIIQKLNLNITIICSFSDDMYRKPRTSMWDLLDGSKPDSFYCGDAGGLPKRIIMDPNTQTNIVIKKDFADTDIKFARNLGIRFMHRDEFVYGVKHDDSSYTLDYPSLATDILPKSSTYSGFKPNLTHPEMIINVGFPGSGKSYHTTKYLTGYVRINRDALGTLDDCIHMTNQALKNKQSVCIDNTNLSINDRKQFISLAKAHGVMCRCLLFTTPVELCRHNAYYRNVITNGKVNAISSVVYNVMKKRFVKPELTEGFDQIIEIDFCPCFDDHDDNNDHDQKNKKYWNYYMF